MSQAPRGKSFRLQNTQTETTNTPRVEAFLAAQAAGAAAGPSAGVSSSSSVSLAASTAPRILADTPVEADPALTGAVDLPRLLSILKDSGARGDRVTISANPFIRGSSLPGSEVHIVVDGVDNGTILKAGANGKFFGRLGSVLGDGSHQIQLYYLDTQGHRIDGDVATIAIDRTRPDPLLTSIGNDTGVVGDLITSAHRLVYSGTSEAGSRLTLLLDGTALTTLTVAANGQWSYAAQADLTDGVHTLTLLAQDRAGNVGRVTNTIRIVPDLPVDFTLTEDRGAADFITNVTTQRIQGHASLNGATVQIVDSNNVVIGTTVVVDGAWSIDLSNAAYGTYRVRINDGTTQIYAEQEFILSNRIEGTAGNDVFSAFGNTGETLLGLGGNDVLTGSRGRDQLDGGAGDDRLVASQGGDTLIGGLGDDTLDGAAGGDSLEGGDSLSGGIGNDYYILGDFVDVVAAENFNEGVDTVLVNYDRDYILGANLENLILGLDAFNGTGNASDNVITGNGLSNQLSGLGGNDTLNGGANADVLIGGIGNDYYIIDTISDSVTENLDEGIDTVEVRYSTITFTLSAANVENLILGAGVNNGTGNALDNVITGNAANNTLAGAGGNDTLDGGVGDDWLIGGIGNDYYIIDTLSDLVFENLDEGIDTIEIRYATTNYTLGANVENLILGAGVINGTGNALDNVITGNAANNQLLGLGGNDTLYGGDGRDTLIGGIGNDYYILSDSLDGVQENFNEGVDTVEVRYATADYSLGTNLENLILAAGVGNGTGNALNNVITGNAANNALSGLGGNDILYGGEGRDSLDGGLGDDTLDGGAGTDFLERDFLSGGQGNDYFIVDSIYDTLYEIFGGGIDTVEVRGLVNYSLGALADQENLILGLGALNGTGNALDNVITGNAADNALSGLGGNDTLDGGDGRDSLIGGIGNDYYILSDSLNGMQENFNEGVDTVEVRYATADYTLGANLENLILGAGVSNGIGNALDNVITCNGANNALSGLGGNDTLDGGAGADTLTGGIGNDYYILDVLSDLVVENLNEGVDTVEVRYATTNYTLDVNLENLILGAGVINGTGNTSDNVITGNANANSLSGGAGNDTIYGGEGNDTIFGAGQPTSTDNNLLFGGAGNDWLNADNRGANTLYGDEGSDTLTGGRGNDSLFGGIQSDSLFGGNGNDWLEGDAIGTQGLTSGDTLDGGTGNDTMSGGVGNDVYILSSVADVVVEYSFDPVSGYYGGVDRVLLGFGAAGGILDLNTIDRSAYANIEGFGAADSLGNVTILGSTANEILIGNIGNNSIIGGGSDTLEGNDGNDILVINLAQDQRALILGGQGNDILKPKEGSFVRTFNIYDGGSGNDTIIGYEQVATLIGGDGDDALTGLAQETLLGGDGRDTLTVMSSSNFLSGGNDDDVLTAPDSSNNSLFGDGGDDTLTGWGSQLNGGDGNDLLTSIFNGASASTLDGGAGSDTLDASGTRTLLVFTADAAGSIDTILNFNFAVDDQINLRDLLDHLGIINRTIGTGYEVRSGTQLWIDTDNAGGTDTQIATFVSPLGTFDIGASDFIV